MASGPGQYREDGQAVAAKGLVASVGFVLLSSLTLLVTEEICGRFGPFDGSISYTSAR